MASYYSGSIYGVTSGGVVSRNELSDACFVQIHTSGIIKLGASVIKVEPCTLVDLSVHSQITLVGTHEFSIISHADVVGLYPFFGFRSVSNFRSGVTSVEQSSLPSLRRLVNGLEPQRS